MKHLSEADRKKAARKRKTKRIAFCVFAALFAVSAIKVIADKSEDRKAAKAYEELRLSIREKEYKEESERLSALAVSEGIPAAPEVPKEEKTPEQEAPAARAVISMDFAPLKEINPEIVGWIQADGTNIDYPVVRAEDNEYYLEHLYNRQVNDHGAIFMDYRNSGDFSDKNTVIYGHHMGNGTMFATLREYRFQAFYDANPVMSLCTPEGDYRVELLCGTIEDGDHEFVRFEFDSDEDFMNYIERFREKSTFISDVELQPEDRVVSLCTCSYETANARYMVIGKLIPLTEPTEKSE